MGVQGHRFVGRDLGLGGLSGANANGHLCDPALGVPGALRSGFFQQLEGFARIADIAGRRGLEQQQLGLHIRRQGSVRKAGLRQQLIRLALRRHGFGQQQHHLGRVDAELQGFVERHLGRIGLAIGQQSATQQHLHRQHLAVELDGVLELNDGALVILLLEANQRVFVELRGLGIGRHRHADAGAEEPGDQVVAPSRTSD